MKKVLFATTALIASATMAAAEIKISGNARFGLGYTSGTDVIGGSGGYPSNGNDKNLNGVSKTYIVSRFRLQFDASTVTDGGVTLGGRMRIEADNGPGNVQEVGLLSAPRLFASYGGFTIGVGNIIGAFEGTPGLYLNTRSAGAGLDGMQYVSNVGNVNNEYFNWDYFDSDGIGFNGVEVLYSAGAFAGHISYSSSNGNLTNPAPVTSGALGNTAGSLGRERAAVNVSYTFGDWTAALGYQDSNYRFEDKTVVTLGGKLGQFGLNFAYADNDGIDKFMISGDMDIGTASNILVWATVEDAVSAAQVAAGRNDNRDAIAGSNQQEGTSYGINYSYDLGGGASFEAGAQRTSYGNSQVQAGVAFSF